MLQKMNEVIGENMKKEFTYQHTRIACYLTFFYSAAVGMMLGILMTTLNEKFSLSLEQLGTLVSFPALVWMISVPIAGKITDKTGYRAMALAMSVFYGLGFIGIGIFPYVFPSPFAGLTVAVCFYTIGVSISEAINNPIIESLPSENKDVEINRLHAVLSFGQVLFVAVSFGLFSTSGKDYWYVLPLLYAVVPVITFVLFLKVPLMPVCPAEERTPLKKIAGNKIFILLLFLILFEGGVEWCMMQYGSLFAELALKVPKSAGDIIGPGMYALGAGCSRLIYSVKGGKIKIEKALLVCSLGCCFFYEVTAFSSNPVLSLAGFAGVGLSVGIMVPGIFCIVANNFPMGGAQIYGVVCGFLYIGSFVTLNTIPKMTSYIERTEPAIVKKLFPNAVSTELGLKFSIAIVGLYAVVMAVLLWEINKAEKTQRI